jgi:hypothetical protein
MIHRRCALVGERYERQRVDAQAGGDRLEEDADEGAVDLGVGPGAYPMRKGVAGALRESKGDRGGGKGDCGP